MAPPNLRQVVRYLRETVSLAPYGLKRAAATPQLLAVPRTQGCQKKLRHLSGSRVSLAKLNKVCFLAMCWVSLGLTLRQHRLQEHGSWQAAGIHTSVQPNLHRCVRCACNNGCLIQPEALGMEFPGLLESPFQAIICGIA
jgi:hypothetical protein